MSIEDINWYLIIDGVNKRHITRTLQRTVWLDGVLQVVPAMDFCQGPLTLMLKANMWLLSPCPFLVHWDTYRGT